MNNALEHETRGATMVAAVYQKALAALMEPGHVTVLGVFTQGKRFLIASSV